MDASKGDNGSLSLGRFGYGMGLSLGVLAVVMLITLAFCIISRKSRRRQAETSHPNPAETSDEDSVTMEEGLDEAKLSTYPRLVYSQAKLHDATSCSICLTDYTETDLLRMIPNCNHIFHSKCVDHWLRRHPSCPMCRNCPGSSPPPTATRPN